MSEQKRDPEIMAMEAVFDYMDNADDRQRCGFMFHLTYRYFPQGMFSPTALAAQTKTALGTHPGTQIPADKGPAPAP